ncbi:MAG: hypothetical protein LBU36_05410 [Clostridiales bacterium]|nr:hypothetical protein [Clostridiales bacterium]
MTELFNDSNRESPPQAAGLPRARKLSSDIAVTAASANNNTSEAEKVA